MSHTAPHHASSGTPAAKRVLDLNEGGAYAEHLTDKMQALQDRAARERYAPDPIETLSSRISDELLDGTLSIPTLESTVRVLRDINLKTRAAKLRTYVGLSEQSAPETRLDEAARQIVESCETAEILSKTLSRPGLAAVFTAHPTFALADTVYRHIVAIASDPTHCLPDLESHRRTAPPTLADEQALALTAILRGRDALDMFTSAIIRHATTRWPDIVLDVRALTLATWVGFDTDGRSDIKWWNTLRIRLALKRTQLERLRTQLEPLLPHCSHLVARIDVALGALKEQETACPDQDRHDASAIVAFAQALIGRRKAALTSAAILQPLFDEALATIDAPRRQALLTAQSGFMAHGLGAAHIHTRLNATQIYNVIRHRLGIEDDPTIPSRKRLVLAQINEALEALKSPIAVDFGSVMMEQSSAGRLMMTMAQILKHIDTDTPIRFLIAETESGYTLLATLWLARMLGIRDEQIQISPLFETQSALEHGETILEEAFRSPYWRDYTRNNGRLCLQFGYSDSGRYIGQLAATNLVERLRLRTLQLLQKHEMQDIELVLFDTHGESIGRGAHPFSLADRLSYFSPDHTRGLFAKANIKLREEIAFQGADGYTLFGTTQLANATIATLAEHLVRPLATSHDPIYEEPDFSADFFSTIALDMANLVEDPGYAGLLGAFGPALIDKSGSRPSARQNDGVSVTRITHPSQLRAIPNNAILEQLGWWTNVLQGFGTAALRHPETFEKLACSSRRFGLALDFARQAAAHSDIGALRGIVRLLDPGTWLDRAASARNDDQRSQHLLLAQGLEGLDFWRSLPAMFRRIQADHIALKTLWGHTIAMSAQERTLHAIRHAVIGQIWLLATRIPYFSPRNDIDRETLLCLVLQLEIPVVLQRLAEIFPLSVGLKTELDFHEPHGPRDDQGFTREHEEIVAPMARLFAIVREISVAIMHANGSFG